MRKTSMLVFEVLEKAWATRNCALIDMKIEFGIGNNGDILVADVIDSDSWRLWPSGDKRLMVDKQVYRNLTTVTQSDLDTVKRNFEWVKDQLDHLIPPVGHIIVILMGSPSDMDHCRTIKKHCESLGLNVEMRVTSAHKGTEETMKIVSYYESLPQKVMNILKFCANFLKNSNLKIKSQILFLFCFVSDCFYSCCRSIQWSRSSSFRQHQFSSDKLPTSNKR